MERKKLRSIIGLIVILLLANLVLIIYFSCFDKDLDEMMIVFLDVGQGDSILIQSPKGENILIDGGPDRNIIYKLSSYIPQNKRKIDLMILTHPDTDHLTGLNEVLERYEVENIIYNGVEDNDPIYKEWQNLIESHEISSLIINNEKRLRIDEDFYFDFFWPIEDIKGKDFDNDNLYSLVMKMNFKNKTILFTGDIEEEVEEELIKRNVNLKADILKVAHHGAKNASTLEFLEKVKPTYGIISVGKDNPFGHPSLRVIHNLEKIGTKVLSTAEMGDIIFKIKGNELYLLTE